MSPLARLLGLSAVVLTAVVAAALLAQMWMQRQEQRMIAAARVELAEQLEAAVTLTGGVDAAWTAEREAAVAAVTGAQVHLAPTAPDAASEGPLHVAIPVVAGQWLVASHPPPATERIFALMQRVTLALGVFAVLLFAIFGVVFGARQVRETETRSPFERHASDVRSLSFLARTSTEQAAELDLERDERLRAEQAASERLQLLNRALEEKIRMGRDLHDGVIQTLYAAGLTLQSAQELTERDPVRAREGLDSGLQLINRTIAEIRAYIQGLSPLQVRKLSLSQGISDMVNDLRAGRPLDLDLRVEDQAAGALSDEQAHATLQIAREAVSNALRHGGAGRIALALSAKSTAVELSVRDDGTGFDPTAVSSDGHGLANMRERATQAGGVFELTSDPGGGSLVTVRWPTAPLT